MRPCLEHRTAVCYVFLWSVWTCNLFCDTLLWLVLISSSSVSAAFLTCYFIFLCFCTNHLGVGFPSDKSKLSLQYHFHVSKYISLLALITYERGRTPISRYRCSIGTFPWEFVIPLVDSCLKQQSLQCQYL